MASFKVCNVNIAGIAACVPGNKVSNYDNQLQVRDDVEKLIQSTGIETRRIAVEGVCASDLSIKAAETLLNDLGWNKNDIEILIFVSQTGDYKFPITSALLQHRLQLPKTCIAIDIPLGCSGYVYGLATISSFIQASKLKRALLIVSDTISKTISQHDKSAEPIFGDAATVTALEYDETAKEMFFCMGTDGGGADSIIMPDGGYRNPVTSASLGLREIEPGIKRNNCHLVLDGMNVFTFGLAEVPKNVNEILDYSNLTTDDIDYFVFHQANLFLNEKIRKKLKLLPEKVPYSLKDFGNTSCATIPLTIVTQLKDKVGSNNKLLLCGFGVGLSWGSVVFETNKLQVCELLEY